MPWHSILEAKFSQPLNGGPSFSLRLRLYRAFWSLAWFLLASWTPGPLHFWRRFVLRAFGANMAPRSDVKGSARVWYPPNLTMEERTLLGPGVECYNIAPITVRAGALVSQNAYLCTGSHKLDDPNFQLIARPIMIEKNSWIAAEAFVGPGVRVGEGAVLGARGAAFDDLLPWTVYRGNPARPISTRPKRS